MVLRPGRGTRSGDGPAPPAVARRLHDEGRRRARTRATDQRDRRARTGSRTARCVWTHISISGSGASGRRCARRRRRATARSSAGTCDLDSAQSACATSTRPQVSALYADLSRAGSVRSGGPLAPVMIAAVHRVLRKACNDAVDAGLLTSSLLVGVRPPWREPPEIQTWSVSEAQAFLAAARPDRLFALWALVLANRPAPRRGRRSEVGRHRPGHEGARGPTQPCERWLSCARGRAEDAVRTAHGRSRSVEGKGTLGQRRAKELVSAVVRSNVGKEEAERRRDSGPSAKSSSGRRW